MTIHQEENAERSSSSDHGRIIDINSKKRFLQECPIMRDNYSSFVPRYCELDLSSLALFRKVIFESLEMDSKVSNFTIFDVPSSSCSLQFIIAQYLIDFLNYLPFVENIKSLRSPYCVYTNIIYRMASTDMILLEKPPISNHIIKQSLDYIFQLLLNVVNHIAHIYTCIYGAYFLIFHYYINWKKIVMLTQKKTPLTIRYQTPLVFMFSIGKSTKSDKTDDSVGCSPKTKNNIKYDENSNNANTNSNPNIIKEALSSRKEGDRLLHTFSTKSKSNSTTPIYSTDDNVTSQTSLTTNLSTGPLIKQNFLPQSPISNVFTNKQKKKSKFYHAPTPIKRHTSSQKLSELQAEFLESVQYSTSIDLTLSSRYGSLDTCSIALENVSNGKGKLNNNPWEKES